MCAVVFLVFRSDAASHRRVIMNVQELYALSSNEVEFTGEEEMVTFVPAMRMGALELIDVGVSCWSSLRGVHVLSCRALNSQPQGSYGPFEPQEPVDVPLWVAIQLKRRFNKSRIEAPAWLEIGAVNDCNHLYISVRCAAWVHRLVGLICYPLHRLFAAVTAT